jgi:putative copper export protein
MAEFLHLFMRWLHIASAASLVGGVLYGAAVLWPRVPEQGPQWAARAAALFRPIALGSVAGLIVSGVYTLVMVRGHTPVYHMMLGIKLLLALHVFAVALMLAANKARRPARAMAGAAISGFVIIAIAAWLHSTF